MAFQKYNIRLKTKLRGKMRRVFIRKILGIPQEDALPSGWFNEGFTIQLYQDHKYRISIVRAVGDNRVKQVYL